MTQNPLFTMFLKQNQPMCASEARTSQSLWFIRTMCECFLYGTHQTIARLRLLVSPSVTQRHGQNRIREDSCCVPCVLCLSWEEKFANGTDTGSHQGETCSWPEFNTISGVICATACVTPGRYNKLLCRATSQRRCCLWVSCHARLN